MLDSERMQEEIDMETAKLQKYKCSIENLESKATATEEQIEYLKFDKEQCLKREAREGKEEKAAEIRAYEDACMPER